MLWGLRCLINIFSAFHAPPVHSQRILKIGNAVTNVVALVIPRFLQNQKGAQGNDRNVLSPMIPVFMAGNAVAAGKVVPVSR